MKQKFDVATFDVAKFDGILARGLSNGLGDRNGSMCIEAAICTVLELPHGDDPQCVAASVRRFKIKLNDSNWSSPKSRAEGLRDLGLAQLGSLGVVGDTEFVSKIAEKLIRVLIPKLFRQVFPANDKCLAAARMCEEDDAAYAADAAANAAANAAAAYAANAASAAAYAANAANAAYAAYDAAAAYAAYAANAASAASAAAYAANAANAANAAYAAYAAADGDEYLNLMASIGLEVLRELKSPGCALLEPVA